MKTILIASAANGLLWSLFVGISATLVVELFGWSNTIPLILALITFLGVGCISVFAMGFITGANTEDDCD